MDKIKLSLIKLAISNDKVAINELLKLEQNNIISMLYYLKTDKEDILDIAQEILLKLSKNVHNLKNPNLFKSWMNKVILNTFYDYIKRKKHNLPLIDNNNLKEITDEDINNPQNKLLSLELDKVVKKSISQLPIKYKIPLTLREIQGLTYNDISSITNTSLGTVKSRISRARGIVQNDLRKYSNG